MPKAAYSGFKWRPTLAMDRAAESKTLYVNRRLTNAADLIAWARGNGFEKTLPAEDIHVTVAFSKTPVDWDAAGRSADGVTVTQTDGRKVGPLGDKGAVVLHFQSPELSERWKEFKSAGAVWDYPTYKPHVTISYDAGDVDLSKVTPYDGPLEFGPEIFAEVDGKWFDKVTAKTSTASDGAIRLALDRESVRRTDPNGYLHVATTNISKACVNPYLGREIPECEALGLDPDKIYNLLRDPDELAKAAPTFNNLPLLSEHVPVSAEEHPHDLVIGSTGSNAAFEFPFLRNSLVLWPKSGIDAVESGLRKELSCAYRYRADMTPGEFEGQAYDGVMRDIVGNHVAAVKEGRAGPDVVVGDSKLETTDMSALTRKAIFALGGVAAYLGPIMAADAKMPDLTPVFTGVNAKNFGAKKPEILAGIKKATKGKLAQDADLDGLIKLVDALEGTQVEEGTDIDPATGLPTLKKAVVADDDPMEKLMAFLADKLDPETLAAAKQIVGGTDEEEEVVGDDPPPFKGMPKVGGAKDKQPEDKDDKPITKAAMDAAIKLAADSTAKKVRAETIQAQKDIREAEKAVAPYVGEIIAQDSAENVYRVALETLGVDVTGVHPTAFPTILKMQQLPGQSRSGARVAQDEAPDAKGFASRFPEADKIGQAG